MRYIYKPYFTYTETEALKSSIRHTGSSKITIWTQVVWFQVSKTTMLILPPNWLFQQMQQVGKKSTLMSAHEAELKIQCQEKIFVMPPWLSSHPGRSLCKIEKQPPLWAICTPDQPSDKVRPCDKSGEERCGISMQGQLYLYFILESTGSQFGLHHTVEYYTAPRMNDLHLQNSMSESTIGDGAWKQA